MKCEQTREINVNMVHCDDQKRHLPPSRAAIDAMKESLEKIGQIAPISVFPISPREGRYRLIAGATRFRAAAELNRQTIRAEIWTGTEVELQILELAENADRRDLNAAQRKAIKAKIRELQKQQLAAVAPAKGGRGKKGGVREAARQAGIPESTARDKLRENTKSRAVSEPAKPRQELNSVAVSEPPPPPADRQCTEPPPADKVVTFPTSAPAATRRGGGHLGPKVSTSLSESGLQWFDGWCAAQGLNRADGLRRLIYEEQKREKSKAAAQ